MKELTSLICEFCQNHFLRSKRQMSSHEIRNCEHWFCSQNCSHQFYSKKKLVTCKNCSKEFVKLANQIEKTKGNNFCSTSCAGKFNIEHRDFGIRRSQLEKWIESMLKEKFPDLEVLYNSKKEIKSEIDIYIPSLKLAIEISGPHHYFPIFGKQKLGDIQRNDHKKAERCKEKNIELIVINVSDMRQFRDIRLLTCTDQVVEEIRKRLARAARIELTRYVFHEEIP